YIKHMVFDIGENEEMTEEEAIQALRDKCKELYDEEGIDIPHINIKADLLLLERTEEYKDIRALVRVNLGDIVSCTDNPLNITFESKVIRIKKDVLSNTNVEVELGQTQLGMSDSINKIRDRVREDIDESHSFLQDAINRATDRITSALGGNVLKRPGELLIMDTDDVMTAERVWRWN